MSWGGICSVGFDFLNLQRVPGSVLAEHYQPLIAVEIPERDVRKEMIAKVGLRFRDVRDGPRPGLAQFRDEFGRIDPSPRRKCGFPRLEFGVSGIRHAKSKMLFRLGLRLLFGLRRPFQSFRYC